MHNPKSTRTPILDTRYTQWTEKDRYKSQHHPPNHGQNQTQGWWPWCPTRLCYKSTGSSVLDIPLPQQTEKDRYIPYRNRYHYKRQKPTVSSPTSKVAPQRPKQCQRPRL